MAFRTSKKQNKTKPKQNKKHNHNDRRLAADPCASADALSDAARRDDRRRAAAVPRGHSRRAPRGRCQGGHWPGMVARAQGRRGPRDRRARDRDRVRDRYRYRDWDRYRDCDCDCDCDCGWDRDCDCDWDYGCRRCGDRRRDGRRQPRLGVVGARRCHVAAARHAAARHAALRAAAGLARVRRGQGPVRADERGR
jgi:hypothetical protein